MNAETDKVAGIENIFRSIEGLLMNRNKDVRCCCCSKIPVCTKCGEVLCETPSESGCHLSGHFNMPEGLKCLKCYDKDERGGGNCKIFPRS